MIPRIAWLLARPGTTGVTTTVLPVVAFATVTTLLLLVFGGAQKFFSWSDGDAVLYQLCAVVALALLVIPLSSLGAAASRLSARRRDDRLATLRLLGASSSTVTTITVIESSVLAAVGAIGGVAVYLVTAPLVGLIPFRGEALGSAVFLPPLGVALIIAGVIALAAASAVLGLRKVIISPLGVRMRSEVPKPHWIRLIVGVGVIAATNIVMGALGGLELTVVFSILAAGFGGSLLVLNLVGPWVLRITAQGQVKRASTPERLLGARRVLESPKAAWSQVGGVAMTSFMAVFAGSAVGVLQSMGPDGENPFLYGDIATGVIITVIGSFLMVACSVGVNQAADILDRRDLFQSLAKMGMPLTVMESSRRRMIMSPLLITAFGSAACAAIVAFPLTGATIMFAPLSIVMIAGVLAAGIALVWVGLIATRSVLGSAARLA